MTPGSDRPDSRETADVVVTKSGRLCQHPHATRGSDWLFDIPTTGVEPGQLALLTDVGWVPFCGWDCQRSQAAAGVLAQRFLDARVVVDAAQWPGSLRFLADGQPVPHFTEERFALPQMALSMALAEREERFCIADHLREQMGQHRRRSQGWRCICGGDRGASRFIVGGTTA